MMDKKYMSQIGTKCASLDKKLNFQYFNSVKINKSPRLMICSLQAQYFNHWAMAAYN